MRFGILIIGFNRPSLIKEALEDVTRLSIKNIFVAVDAPREDNQLDEILVGEVRDIVSRYESKLKIKKLYAEKNYGSGEWPINAIRWAFLYVDTLLILEDDVRIHHDFLDLNIRLLEMYKEDRRVMAICASNIVEKDNNIDDNYFFTKYFSGWGWATWKDRFEQYEPEIKGLGIKTVFKFLKINNFNFLMTLYYLLNLLLIKNKKLQAWDYQMNYLMFTKNLVAIKPRNNMSLNMGTGESATHTKFMPQQEMFGLNKKIYIQKKDICVHKLDEKKYRKARIRFILKSIFMKFFND